MKQKNISMKRAQCRGDPGLAKVMSIVAVGFLDEPSVTLLASLR